MEKGKAHGHGKQMPRGYTRGMSESNRTSLLPSLLWGNYELISYEKNGSDPYVLYDRWGTIIYEWPADYEPTWVEAREVCQGLGLL